MNRNKIPIPATNIIVAIQIPIMAPKDVRLPPVVGIVKPLYVDVPCMWAIPYRNRLENELGSEVNTKFKILDASMLSNFPNTATLPL
jgi:hypothetical protein